MSEVISVETRTRAARTGGTSANAIYRMVARALESRGVSASYAVDLGCGTGALRNALPNRFTKYIGVDAVRYEGFPSGDDFVQADLNAARLPIDTEAADCVFAVETIEHLENPRALVREMTRIARRGGWVIVTTPNQLSFLSIGTLALKKHFSAFQPVHYPAHITALLDSDLVNIAKECGLAEISIEYSRSGRMALTPLMYPAFISAAFPRMCSDNVLLVARKP